MRRDFLKGRSSVVGAIWRVCGDRWQQRSDCSWLKEFVVGGVSLVRLTVQEFKVADSMKVWTTSTKLREMFHSIWAFGIGWFRLIRKICSSRSWSLLPHLKAKTRNSSYHRDALTLGWMCIGSFGRASPPCFCRKGHYTTGTCDLKNEWGV
jgi:hypothetical protein